MNILHLRNLQHRLKQAVTANGGSILVYVVVVMTIFGLLGAAMVAMFSSATMMSTGTPNYARQARYLAESGMRYAVGQLRTDGYRPSVIDRLNDTAYSIPGVGGFDLNVFGKWFEAAADYSQPSGTITLTIPDGAWVEGFAVPAGAYLVNLKSYRDSIYFGGAAAAGTSAQIQTAPDMSTSPFTVALLDDFQADASQGHRMLVALKPDAAAYTFPAALSAGGTLQVAGTAAGFFPEANGSFYLVSPDGRIERFYYQSVDAQGDLAGLSDTVFLASSDDYIILTERNHAIAATATAGGSGSGGRQTLSMDFRPNIASPQPIPPPLPMSLPPDISRSDFASGDTATPESTTAAVSVDTATAMVTLGGNTSDTAGAAWFGGNVTLGGFDVCTGGTCAFNDGIRAFFVVDYTGTGEGFTFALASGTENNIDAYGGTGETLGYAGTAPVTGKQVFKPKMAVEFDTFSNDLRNDPDDEAWNNRDMIQFVYWGSTVSNPYDDNIHDTGGEAAEKWAVPTGGDVRAKPLIDSSGTALYVNANGDLYGLDPETGDALFPYSNPYFNPFDVTSLSSPALDPAGSIIMGADYYGNGYIKRIQADDSGSVGFKATNGVVDSSPVIDSSGVVYFGTNNGYFYAIDYTAIVTSGSFKAGYPYATSPLAEIKGNAVLSPDESTVCFVTKNPGYLYALNTSTGSLKWKFSLNGVTESSPRVADDGTIYVGSDKGLYAINDNGISASMKWSYPTGNVGSRPAVGPDGTVYVGSDDDKLHAVNPDGTGKWTFTESGIGNVKGSPLVHEDGTIWFGSDGGLGEGFLYVLEPEGDMIDRYDLGGNVQCEATQGPGGAVHVGSDGEKVFAFTNGCQPRNQKTRYFTYDTTDAAAAAGAAVDYDKWLDLVNPSATTKPSVTDEDDWLESGPWAARVEIERSRTLNIRNKYEYTLKMWLRQCADADCNQDTDGQKVADSYFQDTRIEYDAMPPFLTQTVELCSADHGKFDTFIFGFTEATGSAVQAIDITDTQLGFRRPGDFTITNDPDWQ